MQQTLSISMHACVCVHSCVCDGMGCTSPGTHKVSDFLLLCLTSFLTSLPRSFSLVKYTLLTATTTGEQMGLSYRNATLLLLLLLLLCSHFHF